MVDEPYAPGNRVPSLDFGAAATTTVGSFSVHAAVTADDNTHVYPDLSSPCSDAGTCEECMRTLDNREAFKDQRCGWMKAGDVKAAGANTASCEPRVWMQQRGFDEDLSCHQSWGVGMFMELEHWYCDGTAGKAPYPSGRSRAASVEQCAEECKLANTCVPDKRRNCPSSHSALQP